MELHEKVWANNERASHRALWTSGKAHKGEVITLEPSENYLQEALEIAIRYDVSIYDSLFLAQARNLKAGTNNER